MKTKKHSRFSGIAAKARRAGIPPHVVYNRVHRGMPEEQWFEPVRKYTRADDGKPEQAPHVTVDRRPLHLWSFALGAAASAAILLVGRL